MTIAIIITVNMLKVSVTAAISYANTTQTTYTHAFMHATYECSQSTELGWECL